MKTYIAGPMRGYPAFNFPAFNAAATYRRALGDVVFNPAEQDRSKYGDLTPENADDKGFDLRDALAVDLDWIARNADAVYLLDGWENSTGAKAEKALAEALGLEILFQSFGPPTDEVRAVSSTGAEKGVKLARYDLLPADPLRQVAEHYGRGAAKYAARNWERGYEWSKSFGAMQRHCWQFWNGEDADAETGSHHMAAVTFHALALLEFASTCPTFDDRPTSDVGT